MTYWLRLYFFVFYILYICIIDFVFVFFFFQAEDGIRDLVRSRGLGDVYKRQAQPMSRGDLTVTFNGEIYNYVELRNELSLKGHTLSLIHI